VGVDKYRMFEVWANNCTKNLCLRFLSDVQKHRERIRHDVGYHIPELHPDEKCKSKLDK
jgi:hypothetical protein